MSNIASFARINGQVRFREAPTGTEMRAIWSADYLRQLEAIRAFGLPTNLPQTTDGKTTKGTPIVRVRRVLPADYTVTLRRVRESRKS